MAKTLLSATLALGLLAALVEASPNSWTDITLSGDVPDVQNNDGVLGITASRGLLYVLISTMSWIGLDMECEYSTLLTEIDPTSGVCTRLDVATGVTGNPPDQIGPHTLAGFDAWDGKLYKFGGGGWVVVGEQSAWQISNDLHEFDPATRVWQQLDGATGVTGIAPSARYSMGFSASNGSLFVSFGYGSSWENDIFRYEISTKTWSELSSGNSWKKQFGQTMLGDTLYVFGGYDTSFLALQTSDPAAQLTEVAAQGDVPTGNPPNAYIYSPALVAVGEKLVLFGGSVSSEGECCDWHVLNNLHLYSTHTNTWVQVNNAMGQVPPLSDPDRYDHYGSRATVIGGSMYVFGGFATSVQTNTQSAGLFRYEVETEGLDKCPPGLTGPNGGPCTECVAGTYKSETGNAACTNCAAGEYSRAVDTTSDVCQECLVLSRQCDCLVLGC